jgi:hypothetical protein
MRRRGALAATAALALLGGVAMAQPAATDPAPPAATSRTPSAASARAAAARPVPPRRTARRPLPAPPPAPPPVVARGEPAPVPDRDLEAPRDRRASQPVPRLDPALIDPNEPRIGGITDRNNPQAREDRLLRQPAPGARLRLPFTY